jgi:RND superfamily putative drug exporter
MLERWTRAVVRYRAVVIAAWIVVVLLGFLSASRLPDLLTTSLSVPGTGSTQANTILSRHFGENVEGTFTVVVPFKNATTSKLNAMEHEIAIAASAIPAGKVIQQRAFAGVLYADVGTSLNLLQASDQTGHLRGALREEGLATALVTGPPALNHDIAPVLSSDLLRGELLAGVLALLLLISVLGLCWAVAVPYVVAASTTAAAIGVVFLLAHHFLMVLYIPNVVELFGLGLAIDYSLLILHRYRSEVDVEGADVEDAIVATMVTAGRTIVLSGLTVAIGVATLLFVPVPFVRSLGAAGLVVPIVAILAALTLQPAILSLLGRRGVRPVAVRGIFRPNNADGAWARVTRRVIERPVTVMLCALGVLALLMTSALWLQLTPGSVVAVPQNLQSTRALTLVSTRVGPGLITPNEIVIDLGHAHLANTPALVADRLALAKAILHDREVFAVAIDTKSPFVDATGRYEQIIVVGRHEFGAEASQQFVRELRNDYIPRAHFPSGTKIYLGGAPAQGVDFLTSVYGAFPWIVLLALVLAYLVLVRAFRSIVLPLLAVVLDLLSVGAAYGVLVLVFRFGVLSSVLGTYKVSQIEGWVPVFLFATLFGLSMDYEVFIVSRMREAFTHGAAGKDAIVDGLANTGGVVTAAAVIMVGALCGLVFGHVAGLQELGVGLSAGVLIDATIVRGLLLPSVMALLGRASWWLPSRHDVATPQR